MYLRDHIALVNYRGATEIKVSSEYIRIPITLWSTLDCEIIKILNLRARRETLSPAYRNRPLLSPLLLTGETRDY